MSSSSSSSSPPPRRTPALAQRSSHRAALSHLRGQAGCLLAGEDLLVALNLAVQLRSLVIASNSRSFFHREPLGGLWRERRSAESGERREDRAADEEGAAAAEEVGETAAGDDQDPEDEGVGVHHPLSGGDVGVKSFSICGIATLIAEKSLANTNTATPSRPAPARSPARSACSIRGCPNGRSSRAYLGRRGHARRQPRR
jgi:hypothetical protein